MEVKFSSNLEEAKANLREQGFCILEQLISDDEFAALRERLVTVAEQERAAGTAFIYDNDSQRVFSLLNKGPEFEKIVRHPVILELMEEVLDYNFMLSSTHANIAGPGGASMYLHADQTFARPPWPPYALVANSMWMLDDFTAENGATRIVPGSHLLGRQPDYSAGEGNIEATPVVAPAGSVMVFDGRLWHQTGPNITTNQRRHGILNYYCRGYVRQQQNFFTGLARDVLDRADPLMQRLLGMENYMSLGLHDGLPE